MIDVNNKMGQTPGTKKQKQINENAQSLRLLIEKSSGIMSINDTKGNFVYLSPSLAKVTGFSCDTFKNTNLYDYIHPDDLPKIKKIFPNILESPEKEASITVRFRNKSGGWNDFDVSIKNFIDVSCIGGILMNYRDVTERRAFENKLTSEKEKLVVTLKNIGEGVVTTDINGRIILMNSAAEELTGYTQEDAKGKNVDDIVNIADEKTGKRYESVIDKALTSRLVNGYESHTILISKNGESRIISDSGAYIKDKYNNITGTVLVFRDITDKVAIEREIFKNDKIESISLLAGGLAHDFNNILTVILGNISLAKMYIKTGKKDNAIDRLTDVEKALNQARKLTKQLLTFAKGGAPVIKPVLITSLVRDTVSFALSGSKIKYEIIGEDDVWPVDIDEGQISQVINNLIINAKQAMPDGGLITIKYENIVVGKKPSLPLKTGRYVKISFKDTGCGISSEIIQRIFDPYFTTKANGNGLGLSMCYSILKKHGGYITVKSALGKGSTFFIYLPVSKQKTFDTQNDQQVLRGEGRILIMDDNESIRDTAGRILVSLGYEAYFAKDGDEAVKLYSNMKEKGQAPDVILMDLTIPGGTGGTEALKRITAINPEVKAIITSGYPNDPVITDYKKYGFKGAIVKPFNASELSIILHNVMNRQ
ncbi:MAG: PAS domain S-box protein [Clostridiales bacterium]|nr:PAS domain S-box protein [Clostridiales bacterium]